MAACLRGKKRLHDAELVAAAGGWPHRDFCDSCVWLRWPQISGTPVTRQVKTKPDKTDWVRIVRSRSILLPSAIMYIMCTCVDDFFANETPFIKLFSSYHRIVGFLRCFPSPFDRAPGASPWNCQRRCQSWATFGSSKPLPCRLWNVWPSSSSAKSSEMSLKNIPKECTPECSIHFWDTPIYGTPHLLIFVDSWGKIDSVNMINMINMFNHMCIYVHILSLGDLTSDAVLFQLDLNIFKWEYWD